MDDWFVSDPDEVTPDPADSLWTYDDGSLWDLGPADLDADGDGVADSVTSELDGDHVVLTDTDGDGRVDRLTELRPDGTVRVVDADRESLPWSPTSLGRLE